MGPKTEKRPDPLPVVEAGYRPEGYCSICRVQDFTRSGTVGFCPHFYGAFCVSDAEFRAPKFPNPVLPKSMAVLIALIEANYSNELITYIFDELDEVLVCMEFLAEGHSVERFLQDGKKLWYLIGPQSPKVSGVSDCSRSVAFQTVAFGFAGVRVSFEDTKLGRVKHKDHVLRHPKFFLRKTRLFLTPGPDECFIPKPPK